VEDRVEEVHYQVQEVQEIVHQLVLLKEILEEQVKHQVYLLLAGEVEELLHQEEMERPLTVVKLEQEEQDLQIVFQVQL
jgi:hypothetical protein